MSGTVGRPTKEASRAGTEDEVVRLYRTGKKIGKPGEPGTICGMMNMGRTTVWEIVKRAKTTPTVTAQIQKERKYKKETNDEFWQEPAMKEYVEDMRLRRVSDGGISKVVGNIRKMCESLEVYPDQLVPLVDQDTGKRDFSWAQKWLAMNRDVSLDKLREVKIAYRGFAKKFGASDYELTIAGFDAKHYGVGKWKTVQMTDEQAKAVGEYLEAVAKTEGPGKKEALFAFRFGLETCRTREPIYGLKSDQFYTLATPDGKVLHCANVFRKKTEKSGAPYKTAYVSERTFVLAKELGEVHRGSVMDDVREEDVNGVLRQAYSSCGVHARDPEFEGPAEKAPDYFQIHPIHALRHAGAMRLLRLTNYNRAVVAELGGWEAEKTLEDHYGGVPQDVVRAVVGGIL